MRHCDQSCVLNRDIAQDSLQYAYKARRECHLDVVSSRQLLFHRSGFQAFRFSGFQAFVSFKCSPARSLNAYSDGIVSVLSTYIWNTERERLSSKLCIYRAQFAPPPTVRHSPLAARRLTFYNGSIVRTPLGQAQYSVLHLQ